MTVENGKHKDTDVGRARQAPMDTSFFTILSEQPWHKLVTRNQLLKESKTYFAQLHCDLMPPPSFCSFQMAKIQLSKWGCLSTCKTFFLLG